jgi:hypothetical protein
MQVVEEFDSVTIKRLRKQGGFLLRMHQSELAKDPTSLCIYCDDPRLRRWPSLRFCSPVIAIR